MYIKVIIYNDNLLNNNFKLNIENKIAILENIIS